MKTCGRRSGFVFLEGLLVLLFSLAILGLGVVLVLHISIGPVSWYWWLVGAGALPLAFIVWWQIFEFRWSQIDNRKKKRDSN
jgi:hypothetical protein